MVNGKKDRIYLVINDIQKKANGLKGATLGVAKVPNSLYSKRIFIVDEQIEELQDEIKSFRKKARYLRLKIENADRDIRILERIKKRVGDALCQDTVSSAKGSESGSSKKKRKLRRL